MELTCEQLGITPDDIADRVAKKIADQMLATIVPDYDDESSESIETEKPTAFQLLVRKRVAQKVEQAVDAMAEKAIGGDLEAKLASLKFPQTNSYGEPKSEPLTLMEFIAKRADTYLTEKVDYQGRTGYSASGLDRTRVVWMLEQFLAERIRDEAQRALKNANAVIVGGIEATVKASLADIANRLAVSSVVKPKA